VAKRASGLRRVITGLIPVETPFDARRHTKAVSARLSCRRPSCCQRPFFGPLAHLARLTGGLTPFDIRPKGYSYADARAFLEAIGEQGRRYYASPQLVIDTLYPPLYAVSRGLALWWLTMPGRVREAPVPLTVRYALIAVPILMASLDLLENGCIAMMLWMWPLLPQRLAEVSSLATQAKIMAGVLTEILMGVLGAIWLARWGMRRWT
jgi:hypothetical protein